MEHNAEEKSANADMKISPAGYALLRLNEGVRMRYYNDAPKEGNCTWGVGTLAHFGPCTPEEMRRVVTVDQVNSVLRRRAEEAAKIVRSIVTDYRLTQAQFDAAVSFAYNSRTKDIRETLAPANHGNFAAVVAAMMSRVYVHPRDRTGKIIGPAKRFLGLVNRRLRESRPFRQN